MLFFSESAYFRYIFNNIIFLGISLQYFNLCCNSSLFNSCDWLVVSSFFFFKSYSKKVDFIKKWLVTYSHYAVNITLLPTQNYFQRQIENKRNILLRILRINHSVVSDSLPTVAYEASPCMGFSRQEY